VSSGNLTLDAQHDDGAVFIFQMATTFESSSLGHVTLANGAKADNIFWQVGSSATLGQDCIIEGTMMAHASITSGTGAIVNGRVLAGAAVTMNAAVVTRPGGLGLWTA
jgi:UDP-3-O-[3-hydroxymyristoyl] glucosamine N-acyltransferase